MSIWILLALLGLGLIGLALYRRLRSQSGVPQIVALGTSLAGVGFAIQWLTHLSSQDATRVNLALWIATALGVGLFAWGVARSVRGQLRGSRPLVGVGVTIALLGLGANRLSAVAQTAGLPGSAIETINAATQAGSNAVVAASPSAIGASTRPVTQTVAAAQPTPSVSLASPDAPVSDAALVSASNATAPTTQDAAPNGTSTTKEAAAPDAPAASGSPAMGAQPSVPSIAATPVTSELSVTTNTDAAAVNLTQDGRSVAHASGAQVHFKLNVGRYTLEVSAPNRAPYQIEITVPNVQTLSVQL